MTSLEILNFSLRNGSSLLNEAKKKKKNRTALLSDSRGQHIRQFCESVSGMEILRWKNPQST